MNSDNQPNARLSRMSVPRPRRRTPSGDLHTRDAIWNFEVTPEYWEGLGPGCHTASSTILETGFVEVEGAVGGA